MALRAENRHASGCDLAADIESWLADEPTSAMPNRWFDRALCFARKHRAWTRAGAVALLLIALVSAAATLLIFKMLATRESCAYFNSTAASAGFPTNLECFTWADMPHLDHLLTVWGSLDPVRHPRQKSELCIRRWSAARKRYVSHQLTK